jgi:hypothetical protein
MRGSRGSGERQKKREEKRIDGRGKQTTYKLQAFL